MLFNIYGKRSDSFKKDATEFNWLLLTSKYDFRDRNNQQIAFCSGEASSSKNQGEMGLSNFGAQG